eukprot:40223_1
MNELLFILSILLSHLSHIVYSKDCYFDAGTLCSEAGCGSSDGMAGCSCNAAAAPDVMFSVSTHLSVLDVIGFDTEITFLKQIAGAGIVNGGGFGLQTFATAVTTVQALGDTSDHGEAIEDYFDGITEPSGTASYGNDLQLAMDAMNTAMEARDDANQKIHIVVLTYDPKNGADGTNTQTTSLNDPCSDGIQSKRNNIRNYVLAIGEDGVDFHKEFFECIVEDIENDIIIVDPTSTDAALTKILNLICVTDYQFKITEVKPSNAAHEDLTQTKRFVEGYNFGKSIPVGAITMIWSLGSSGTNSMIIPQGEYFTFYDSSDTSSGSDPSGSYNTNLDFGTDSQTAWSATLQVTLDSSIKDVVQHTSTTGSGWQTIPDGFSYELRAGTMQNDYGLNWRASCVIGGNGGLSPTVNEVFDGDSSQWRCVAVAGNCDDTTTDPCDLNTGTGTCNTATTMCECLGDGATFGDMGTCLDMLIPGDTLSDGSTPVCTGTIIKEKVGSVYQDVLILTWDKVEYDGYAQYTANYESSTGSTVSTTVGYVNAWATKDFADYSGIGSTVSYATISVTYTNGDDTSKTGESATDGSFDCLVETENPTESPTTDPTREPTLKPTVVPTPQPTFEEAACFLYSDEFCGVPRCECFGDPRSCCDGSDDDEECDIPTLGIEIATDSEDFETPVYFRMYPSEWAFPVTVYYEIYQYGTVNKTIYVDEDTDEDTQRRRYSRRLLQNITTTEGNMTTTTYTFTTPTTTTGFKNESENKIKVSMDPVGIGMVTLGNINDATLEANVTLILNQASIVCEEGDPDCVTEDECNDYAAHYVMEILNCTTDNTEDTPLEDDPCSTLYPHYINILAFRGDCAVIFAGDDAGSALPDWWWIILIALIVFLLILAWLVYRFWWKQKKAAGELGDAEDELDQQIADNNAGFGADLDTGDVAFNPMATGVPGMNRPADAFGNEIHERQQHAQNEMVNVNAEKFEVRHQMGQQYGKGQGGGGY